jgi:hypothetical protein
MSTKCTSVFLAGEAICTDEFFITQSEVFITGVDLSGLSGKAEVESAAERLASICPCSSASTKEGVRLERLWQLNRKNFVVVRECRRLLLPPIPLLECACQRVQLYRVGLLRRGFSVYSTRPSHTRVFNPSGVKVSCRRMCRKFTGSSAE